MGYKVFSVRLEVEENESVEEALGALFGFYKAGTRKRAFIRAAIVNLAKAICDPEAKKEFLAGVKQEIDRYYRK